MGAVAVALAGPLAGPLATAAEAQSAQRLSLQASALYSVLAGDYFAGIDDGPGGEVQARYTFGALSLGGGVQYTRHGMADTDRTLELLGAFLEPRFAFDVGSSSVAPYASGRVSLLSGKASDPGIELSTGGLNLNGGGGLLFALGPQVNLDLGATYGVTNFDDVTITDRRTGSEIVTADDAFDDSGGNFVFRLGLAIGIGR
jgi:hypothetical protein